MYAQLRLFVAACCYYSGLAPLARWWTQRSGQKLIILNYHRASGGDLRRHLLYLRRHYRILHLQEALKELYTSDKGKQVRDLRTLLVLTFDDGYRDNYTHAFALARELRVPITIFLVPGYVDSGDHFWWLEGERLTSHTRVDTMTIEGCTYHLKQSEERVRLARAIDIRLRQATSVAEREGFLAALREALAVSASCATEDETAALPLTWTQIREMEESGWVSFGAHTMHHPILAYLKDLAEIRREVRECRTALEQQLGHQVRMFAYPFGQPEEVGDEASRAVCEVGYDCVLTTIHGVNTVRSNPHELRRIYTEVSRHWLMMAVETTGLWKYFSSLNPFRRILLG